MIKSWHCLRLHTWKHVKLNFMCKELFVRPTAKVVGNDLVIIGGGAACYAFGTKFSEPVKINLFPVPLVSLEDGHKRPGPEKIFVSHQYEGITGEKNVDFQDPDIDLTENSAAEQRIANDGRQMVASHWVVQPDRKYAKLGRDILKKFGWLDLGRKVYQLEDGLHICISVTEKFCAVFHEKQHHFGDESDGLNNVHLSKPYTGEGVSLNEISCSTALQLHKECGATKQVDEVVELKELLNPPLTQ